MKNTFLLTFLKTSSFCSLFLEVRKVNYKKVLFFWRSLIHLHGLRAVHNIKGKRKWDSTFIMGYLYFFFIISLPTVPKNSERKRVFYWTSRLRIWKRRDSHYRWNHIHFLFTFYVVILLYIKKKKKYYYNYILYLLIINSSFIFFNI